MVRLFSTTANFPLIFMPRIVVVTDNSQNRKVNAGFSCYGWFVFSKNGV